MVDLGIKLASATKIEAAWQRNGAHRRGVELFRRFRRFNLIRQMRAEDPVHNAYLNGMRDTTADMPVSPEWVRSLKPLSEQDLQDPEWRFAPIGVLSNLERQTINIEQVKAFAAFHGLPLVRWKKTIDSAQRSALFLTEAEQQAIYDNEPSMWGYYVRGCPAHIIFNIATSRGLVNGCPAIMDSLTLAEGTLKDKLDKMPMGESVLEIDPPLSINVIPDLPPDEMAVLVAAGLSLSAERLVVPVPVHSRPKLHTLRSVYAALHGLPAELKVVDHQLDLGFALTDFKLQSKTKTKLILSLGPRKFAPYFSLSTVYVLVSRVKLGMQLRTIGLDVRRHGHSHLTSLQHPCELGVWESSYNRDGRWDDALREQAIRAATGGERPVPLDDLEQEPDEEDLMPAQADEDDLMFE